MIEYYIKTDDPRTHIAVCEMISLLGVEILEDYFGGPESGYYGKFYVRSVVESFEVIFDFPGVTMEMSDKSVTR